MDLPLQLQARCLRTDWPQAGTEEGNATAVRPYEDRDILINLSVWESIEALEAFVYRSDHIAYLRRRREWFGRMNEAMLTLLDSIPTTASPAVSAMPVLSSGSSAGSTALKNRSRMTRAATTPMRVLDDEAGLVDAAMAPTTSTCRAG